MQRDSVLFRFIKMGTNAPDGRSTSTPMAQYHPTDTEQISNEISDRSFPLEVLAGRKEQGGGWTRSVGTGDCFEITRVKWDATAGH